MERTRSIGLPNIISTIMTHDLHSLVQNVDKNHEHRFSGVEGARKLCIAVGDVKSEVGLSIKLSAGRQSSRLMSEHWVDNGTLVTHVVRT